jgi:hypothetical protein
LISSPVADKDFRAKDVIGGRIQDTSMESLAGDALRLECSSLLPPGAAAYRIIKVEKIRRKVIDSMETIRDRDHGWFSLVFSRSEEPQETRHRQLRALRQALDPSARFLLIFADGRLTCYQDYLGKCHESPHSECPPPLLS